ncbi:MAG: UDP-3-O-(3-hydroxymyristoyl)glucosamine N-acyltransferase [Planctomycetota bacterium]
MPTASATPQQPARTEAPATTGTLATMLDARLVGPDDIPLADIAGLDKATAGALTFIRDSRYAKQWPQSSASAALVSEGVEVPGHDPSDRALLFVPDADRALQALLQAFSERAAPPRPESDESNSSVIHPSANIHPTATIGPMCVIEAGASVGADAVLAARVSIGAGARVGAGSLLQANVSVLHGCTIGERCVLHPGVVIGADGFGYLPGPDGPIKIPHLGSVVVEDDVEIGANTCIDRGKLGDTRIGGHTKIDNLCQIGHNCDIGRSCVICGCCGVSGSVTLGDGVTLAGGVGIGDGITIGPGATVGARSGVMNDIPAGETWLGYPAAPARETAANMAQFRTLARTLREIRKRLPDA